MISLLTMKRPILKQAMIAAPHSPESYFTVVEFTYLLNTINAKYLQSLKKLSFRNVL